MTDTIPEDVLQAAREAYLSVPETPSDKWFRKSVRVGDYDHQMPIRASARAILAERERCVQIIEKHDIATTTGTGADVLVPRRYISKTGMAYADAIRKGDRT